MAIPTDIVSTYTNYAYTDYLNYVNAGNLSASFRALQGITVLIPEQGGIPRFLSAAGISDVSTALKAAIVEYHIISGIYYSSQLPALASNLTALQSYFNGQPIYASDATHWASGKGLNAANIKITKPDILFDSGVIHVVDAVLLPPTIANAQASPSPFPLSQIYPAGQDPTAQPPLASDFPTGSVVGGVLAGVVVIAIAVGLYFVIRRRRLIARLEEEKTTRDLEMDEYLRNHEFTSGRKPSVDVSEFVISGQQQQLQAGADPDLDEDEEESDDESEEEDGGNKQIGIRAAQDQIMNYRRAQWASDDPKRKSVATTNLDKQQKRVSIVEGSRPHAGSSSAGNDSDFLSVGYVAGGGSKRNSAASFNSKQKRMSTVSGHSGLEGIVISDAKEVKKEAVR
ncbi:FAS1 domain-containing protein, partial [Chytriomyces sp. MP71]